MLHKSDKETITSMDTNQLSLEFKQRFPNLLPTLQLLLNKGDELKAHESTCAAVMSIILHTRNQRMSSYAYKVGFFLKWSGLNTVVIFYYFYFQFDIRNNKAIMIS